MTTSNKNQQLTAVGLALLATASAQRGIRPQTFAGRARPVPTLRRGHVDHPEPPWRLPARMLEPDGICVSLGIAVGTGTLPPFVGRCCDLDMTPQRSPHSF